MKQIWPNYSYSPATNVLTLTGLNIDRDQLLLVTAADRGRIMYNFADSSVTASAFTSGANTALTLVATTAGLTTTAALVIYYDDQLQSTAVSISNLPSTQTIAGTVTANLGNPSIFSDNNGIASDQGGGPASYGVQLGYYDGFGYNLVNESAPFPISGTVTANLVGFSNSENAPRKLLTDPDGVLYITPNAVFLPIAGTVTITNSITIGSALPAGTNRIGVVTIGAGTVTIGAGTAQIGSVTASISNSVTIASFATSVTARLINPAGTSVTYAEVGTAGNPSIDVLSVQGVTSGTPLNVYPMQGTSVSNTNFTSTTASTTLVSAVTMRESLTVFNEGAGNLHISPGATCTTVAYQVRLSAGDYWECPQGQLSLLHTAVFATAGTARVCQVS